MNDDIKKAILALAKKSEAQSSGVEAMHFAQAALSLTHASVMIPETQPSESAK